MNQEKIKQTKDELKQAKVKEKVFLSENKEVFTTAKALRKDVEKLEAKLARLEA